MTLPCQRSNTILWERMLFLGMFCWHTSLVWTIWTCIPTTSNRLKLLTVLHCLYRRVIRVLWSKLSNNYILMSTRRARHKHWKNYKIELFLRRKNVLVKLRGVILHCCCNLVIVLPCLCLQVPLNSFYLCKRKRFPKPQTVVHLLKPWVVQFSALCLKHVSRSEYRSWQIMLVDFSNPNICVKLTSSKSSSTIDIVSEKHIETSSTALCKVDSVFEVLLVPFVVSEEIIDSSQVILS